MKPPSPPSALRDAIAVGAPRASPSPTPSKKSDRCSLTAILGTFDFSFQRRSSRIPPHPEAPAIGPISSFRRSTFTPGGVSVSIAKCSILFILLVLGRPAFSALGASQGESAVGITPDAISCWPYDDFVVIQADIGPPAEVGTARVYFRATDFVDFYYVEMARNQEGLFEAVMPQPSQKTTRVIYYIEAVDQKFNAAQTGEYNPTVSPSGSCSYRRFIGVPSIVIGSLVTNVPAVPAGFQAIGITGFTSAGAGGGAAPGP